MPRAASTPISSEEPLLEVPRCEPASRLTALDRQRTFFLDVSADGRTKRVLIAARVCLREGPLEVLLCRTGTKEHESILRTDLDAKLIHAALEAAGASAGRPVQFVNARNEMEFRPATGTRIAVAVHYRKDGTLHTHPAQDWVWNATTKRRLEHDWVFAGSQLIPDPERTTETLYYAANSGEVIGISNFPFSMLDLPVEIGKDDSSLSYEAKSERIPPLNSSIWVILEPVRAPSDSPARG